MPNNWNAGAADEKMSPPHFEARKAHLMAEVRRAQGEGHRSRTVVRRPAVLIAVALAAAVTAVPAIGVIAVIRDVFEGSSPTPQVQEHFRIWDDVAVSTAQAADATNALSHMPFVRAADVHGILALDADEATLYLWGANGDDGKHCWLIDIEQPGGTTADSFIKFGPSGCASTNDVRWFESENVNLPGRVIVLGVVNADATSAELKLSDGSSVRVPVVEHYFLATLSDGQAPQEVVARAADGSVVGDATNDQASRSTSRVGN